MKPIFPLFVSIILALSGYSQSHFASISGKITDTDGVALPFVSVAIDSLSLGTLTDSTGHFTLKNIPPGTHTVTVFSIGFTKQSRTIALKEKSHPKIYFKLKDDVLSLDEVVITRQKSEAQKIEESAFNAQSIETNPVKGQSMDVNQLLKTSPGVVIREAGGLGSNFNFSLGGLSGYRVRFFIDDIPVDYLGDAYRLNNFPVNLVDRIDIYQGVVPIRLGADALGGAVNVVTSNRVNSYVDASYSIGSFGTHRFALNSQYRNKKNGFTFRPKAFYNFSKNNYIMRDMSIYRNKKWDTLDVRRFNDDYLSYSGILEAGFTKVKWADEFLIGYSRSVVKKEDQQDFYLNPLGDVRSEENVHNFTLRYNKTGFLFKKLDLNVFSLYNLIGYKGIDTSSNRYNWLGEIARVSLDDAGEINTTKTLFEYQQKTFLYRTFLEYKISDKQSLSFNYIGYNVSRQGENRLGVPEEEPFRHPNTLNKNIAGLAYEKQYLNKKLITTVAVKYYNFNIHTKKAKTEQNYAIVIQDLETRQNKLGYLFAARYFIRPKLFIKSSYERGYRLPEPDEIFGNGLSTYANPDLLPEGSNNFNVGINFEKAIGKSLFKSEANYIFRDMENYTFRQPYRNGSRFENIYAVLIHGFEFALQYKYGHRLSINSNITRQYVLNNEKYVKGTTKENRVYKDHLPNTPYFFGNLNLNYKIIKNDEKLGIAAYYRLNFVHEFFLGYAAVAKAAAKNVIPSQLVQDIGITAVSGNRKYSLSLECSNLFNALAFDNFNFQKPGRGFSAKFRYYISN